MRFVHIDKKVKRLIHSTNVCVRCYIDLHASPYKHVSNLDEVLMLEVKTNTRNSGDEIISYYADRELRSIFPDRRLEEYPVHAKWVEMDNDKANYIKIVCGTNALSTMMELDCPIAFPKNVGLYRNSLILMASGLRHKGGRLSFSPLSSTLLHHSLNNEFLHSVRDESTRQGLLNIGIRNVVNTSCLTMWGLKPEVCERIPIMKADNALVTITDYSRRPPLDAEMLSIVLSKYRKVYFWPQGVDDLSYLQMLIDYDRLINSNRIEIIGSGLHSLNKFISINSQSIDYIGTRLHCGIHCLNSGIRSLIVSVDNRARDIHRDTNLPIIFREDIPGHLEELIVRSRQTQIHLPWDSIDRWKAQFIQR